MYTGFYEWTVAEKMPALLWRFALLGGAAAVAYSDRYAGEVGTDLSNASRLTMLVIQSALLWTLSAYFCVETRLEDVVGGFDPKRGLSTEQPLQGKIILITGSNAGIGKETAKQLATLGATKIILACRSPKRGQEAMDDLLKASTNLKASQFMVLQCDLGSFDSIRKAVKTLEDQKKDIPKIDILILNAGVMMNDHAMTSDGCEAMMQANLLGHYLLTRLLLDQNIVRPNKQDPPRVLHLTSSTHQIAVVGQDGMDLDDMFCEKGTRTYTLFGQYAQSKLGNILFAKELARRYPRTLVSLACHPGIVRTDVTRNMPVYLRYPNIWFGAIVQLMQKTVPQGAWCTVAGALSKVDMEIMSSYELDVKNFTASQQETNAKTNGNGIPNGSYLQNGKVRPTDLYCYQEAVRVSCFLSLRVCGLL